MFDFRLPFLNTFTTMYSKSFTFWSNWKLKIVKMNPISFFLSKCDISKCQTFLRSFLAFASRTFLFFRAICIWCNLRLVGVGNGRKFSLQIERPFRMTNVVDNCCINNDDDDALAICHFQWQHLNQKTLRWDGWLFAQLGHWGRRKYSEKKKKSFEPFLHLSLEKFH